MSIYKSAIILMLFFLFLFCPAPANARDYYVATNGLDSNTGYSLNSAWQTMQKAFSTIAPGDHVYVRAGIYKNNSFFFTPKGIDFVQKTIFEPYNNEKVLLTGEDNYPAQINIDNFVVVKGFWIGGKRPYDSNSKLLPGAREAGFHPGNGSEGIGFGKEILNNTIFGYGDGIGVGSGQDYLIQGNRFVRTGLGKYGHGIYLSGGSTPKSMAQHVIVDNNIFVAGEGWGIHLWHNPRSNVVTRNFVGMHYHGLVVGGDEELLPDGTYKPTYVDNETLVSNNVIWKQKGTTESNIGVWLPSRRTIYANNIFGPGVRLYAEQTEQNRLTNNAFDSNATANYRGANPYLYTQADILEIFGNTESRIDLAISRLNEYFAGEITQIYSDTRIAPEFAVIDSVKTSSTSRLYQKGYQVFSDDKTPSIGRYTSIRQNFGGLNMLSFWEAFNWHGRKHFNNYFNLVEDPYGMQLNITFTPATRTANVRFYATTPFYYQPQSPIYPNYNATFGMLYWERGLQLPAQYVSFGSSLVSYPDNIFELPQAEKRVDISGLKPNTNYDVMVFYRNNRLDEMKYKTMRSSFKTSPEISQSSGCTPGTGKYSPKICVMTK